MAVEYNQSCTRILESFTCVLGTQFDQRTPKAFSFTEVCFTCMLINMHMTDISSFALFSLPTYVQNSCSFVTSNAKELRLSLLVGDESRSRPAYSLFCSFVSSYLSVRNPLALPVSDMPGRASRIFSLVRVLPCMSLKKCMIV